MLEIRGLPPPTPLGLRRFPSWESLTAIAKKLGDLKKKFAGHARLEGRNLSTPSQGASKKFLEVEGPLKLGLKRPPGRASGFRLAWKNNA